MAEYSGQKENTKKGVTPGVSLPESLHWPIVIYLYIGKP